MTIVEWNGAHVEALRAALRDTQPQFAERLGVSIAVVGKWGTRGETLKLWPRFAEMMDTTFATLNPQQRQLFDAALASVETPRSRPMIGIIDTREDDDVERRQFGAVLGVAALATAAPPLSRVGVGDARRVAALVDDFVARDQESGGASVLPEALDALENANRALDTCDFESSAAEDAFTGAVGNLAAQVGWFAFDSDNHQLARSCYAEALALANVAGDDDLTIQGCVQWAMLALYTGSLGRARRLVARAADLAHGLPPGRVHALLAMRGATMNATLGDSRAFGRSIASAWREMDQAVEHEPIDECPQWLRFVSHAEVQFYEGKGFALLGHQARALEHFDRDVRESANLPRNAVCARTNFGAALASIGDLSSAVVEATPALELLGGGVSSPRALTLLRPLRDVMASRRGGDGFADHYDAVARRLETIAV